MVKPLFYVWTCETCQIWGSEHNPMTFKLSLCSYAWLRDWYILFCWDDDCRDNFLWQEPCVPIPSFDGVAVTYIAHLHKGLLNLGTFLDRNFPERGIFHDGPIAWPLDSFDIIPFDFLLGGEGGGGFTSMTVSAKPCTWSCQTLKKDRCICGKCWHCYAEVYMNTAGIWFRHSGGN